MYHMVQIVDVTVHSPADPARVYRLAADSATWPDWSPVLRYEREKAGDAHGVGEVRVFHNRGRRNPTREEVVELTPNRRVGYVLLSGLAIRGYRASIDLAPDSGGTRIRWHSSFEPKVRGTGWLYRWVLQLVITQYSKGLAARAAH
ncbi:SRPBCC family protein [Actinosynnema sp. NPDC047251]|uniref:Polyketide cyclase/dehydrase n=1 Tax=Saccharothrix espanaensis (strain ATCC 51144 / DSM 44229 / JCM 9112 / NBRC 15066 / NRRL 15764) TaxID=1179773 RepID=K0JWF2_SACES|nr:SRPBCC family protein [Saccharothrix espanaensis]CCH28518.1 hypothetical protein BN6_11920 [Saccharothrix espanaensis DSM 44229]